MLGVNSITLFAKAIKSGTTLKSVKKSYGLFSAAKNKISHSKNVGNHIRAVFDYFFKHDECFRNVVKTAESLSASKARASAKLARGRAFDEIELGLKKVLSSDSSKKIGLLGLNETNGVTKAKQKILKFILQNKDKPDFIVQKLTSDGLVNNPNAFMANISKYFKEHAKMMHDAKMSRKIIDMAKELTPQYALACKDYRQSIRHGNMFLELWNLSSSASDAEKAFVLGSQILKERAIGYNFSRNLVNARQKLQEVTPIFEKALKSVRYNLEKKGF